MADVKKGRILSFLDNKASVSPIDDINKITLSVNIPEYIDTESLSIGDDVAYVVFEDLSGIILSKL